MVSRVEANFLLIPVKLAFLSEDQRKIKPEDVQVEAYTFLLLEYIIAIYV